MGVGGGRRESGRVGGGKTVDDLRFDMFAWECVGVCVGVCWEGGEDVKGAPFRSSVQEDDDLEGRSELKRQIEAFRTNNYISRYL